MVVDLWQGPVEIFSTKSRMNSWTEGIAQCKFRSHHASQMSVDGRRMIT